ncbi:MAG: hypothetical protein HY785_08615 [Oscillatoriophycideae cyanobacterium NC_groundwater_1537_Pr4_S-0.65um_50_18]|nr:hypothetical protein [Oscillatoriophycideae cyanobacterium NC_groundwater_1537_Pr4_S-0.65um_50_18]
MTITEPLTMLTDYAIALQSSGFGILLFRLGRRRQQMAIQLWAIAFGSVAIAALLGGSCHGFALLIEFSTLLLLWKLMLFALSLAGNFMLFAAIKSRLPRRWQAWAGGLVGVKLLAYLSWIVLNPSPEDAFVYGVVDYLSAMLLVLLLELRVALPARSRSCGSGWIIAGILISGVAIAVQTSGLVLFRYLSSNDLYHLVQMIALYGFYRGAKLLKDR